MHYIVIMRDKEPSETIIRQNMFWNASKTFGQVSWVYDYFKTRIPNMISISISIFIYGYGFTIQSIDLSTINI